MATQIVISNNDFILVDDSYHIDWADKGNTMPVISNTIHYVIWNDLIGDNEIQTIDPSTEIMTGNTLLSATSDAVGSTTIDNLLTWAETRKSQINSATIDFQNTYENALVSWTNDGNNESDFHADNSLTHSYFDWEKTWRDYDEHYS